MLHTNDVHRKMSLFPTILATYFSNETHWNRTNKKIACRLSVATGLVSDPKPSPQQLQRHCFFPHSLSLCFHMHSQTRSIETKNKHPIEYFIFCLHLSLLFVCSNYYQLKIGFLINLFVCFYTINAAVNRDTDDLLLITNQINNKVIVFRILIVLMSDVTWSAPGYQLGYCHTYT